MRKPTSWLIEVATSLLLAKAALAAPLDLQNPESRWIEVEFEVSPQNRPGRLDGIWSAPRSAFLDFDAELSVVRIRIPSEEIEAHLRTIGTETIPGSFSDFVWTLDPDTGHVLEAAFTGRVREVLSLGPIRASATVEIAVEMTTLAAAGFRPAKGILGVHTNPYCRPSSRRARCVAVAPIRFDPTSGYVNAVGSVVAASGFVKIRTFSPLGEARFSEHDPNPAESATSGCSHSDALCSPSSTGPTGPISGGIHEHDTTGTGPSDRPIFKPARYTS